MRIFSEVVAKPVTNEGLKIRFVMAGKTGKAAVRKVRPIRTLRTNMKTVRAMIEDKIAKIEVSEMSDLLADLQALALFIQQELAGTVTGTDKTAGKGIYLLSDEERLAIREGLNAAKHGEFASDDEMDEFYKLHRRA